MRTDDVALVTGGSSGIGQAICRDLLEAGYGVVSLDRRPARSSHPALSTVLVDLLDPLATEVAARQAAAGRPISHIVHNAGLIWPKPVEDVGRDDLMGLTQLHLASALTLVQAALPGMKTRGFGRIILMSSRALLGAVTRTAYSATKAGMIGLTRTWALELAPHGITVNAVAPGPIRTEMFHDIVPAGGEREQALARSIPVGRIGEPADVSRAVRFLAAREAGFITGQTLFVCGGASIGSLSI